MRGHTRDSQRSGGEPDRDAGHLQCPFCHAYEIVRLYIAPLHMDSCECTVCGRRWDEDCESGDYRGRSARESILIPRTR